MLNAPLLSIIEEAGIAVLTLTEGSEKEEFLNSRLTRAEVGRQIKIMTDIAGKMPARTCSLMAEVDWTGWAGMARQLNGLGPVADEALWFAIQSLIPATIMWLRVYRKNQPDLFDYTISMQLNS
ncbi:MAG: ribonuclease HepT family protein [Sulfuriferula sp.]